MSNDNKAIAFLGLGVMGGAIAAHLVRAGHRVTVFNRTRAKTEAWVAAREAEGFTATIADNPAEAARDADYVVSCVGTDDDLADVVLGPLGVFSTMKRGSTLIDHTTVSARIARQIAVEARDKQVHCVDAPVTGGQVGAEKGTLSIMCGGRDAAIEAARPVMEIYSSRIVHVGKAGAGQSAKMVNQICIAGVIAGLSEAIRFAQASHLDMGRVFDAISGGAAQSWQMDNRWKSTVEDRFNFGFAVDWMRKDLGLAFDEGRSIGVSLPVTALVDQFYAEVQEFGGGRQDTSALIRHLPPAKGSGR